MLFMNDKNDDASMIARIVREEADTKAVNPALEAKKAAVKKIMAAMRSEDADMFITAMDEFKEIDRPSDDNSSDY